MSSIFEKDKYTSESIKDCISEIREKMDLIHFKKGEILVEQNQENDYIWVFHSGRAEFFRFLSKSKKSKKQVIIRTSDGEVYGFIEMFLGVNTVMSVKIIEDSTVIKIHKDLFRKWLQHDPNLAMNVVSSTIILVRRISRFIQAAPFLLGTNDTSVQSQNMENKPLDQLSTQEIIER